MQKKLPAFAQWLAIALVALVLLYVVFLVYSSGQVVLASTLLVAVCLGFYVYNANRAYTYRYLFPGIAGILVFVVFPIVYTISIGFTNYSSRNLLSFDRAKQYFVDETAPAEGEGYQFSLYSDGKEYRLVFKPKDEESSEAKPADAASKGQTFITDALALAEPIQQQPVPAKPLSQGSFELGQPLELKDIIQKRSVLQKIKVQLPDGTLLSMSGLREFAPQKKLYKENPDGTLTNLLTGQVLKPNFDIGFFVNQAGEPVKPGFKVNVGLTNYSRVFTEPEFREAFFRIFLWTVIFAALTVFFTLSVGITLAVVLNWEALKFRTIYRTLLFLPYAVPGFISILVFRGLFNQNFGEINLILNTLFGIKPAWFGDPFLAKCMILIVNTWLGYPYIMVLCTGLIKAIPADLYEASAIAGAGPLTNFFKITAPLIIKPLTPLLLSESNFNNLY
jgi:maltose/maltodextrin transport system permease protein